MNRRRVWLITMGILSFLTAVLTGCMNKGNLPENQDNEEEYAFESRVIPEDLPEGTELKHLYITHQGMRGGSYYILKTTDTGTYMKITNLRPGDSRMVEGEEAGRPEEHAEYLGFADIVKDCEYASLVLLEDDEPLRQLEAVIVRTGALGWDGYRKSLAMPDVKDSGDTYQLYLELTNGTTVTVDSYNASPVGFSELLYQVAEIFHANRDYSRYQAEDFTTSACTSLYVCFRRAFGKGEWRLELNSRDNQWTAVLMDPDGTFMEAGTEISDYQRMESALPFERFLDIFIKHGAEKWNGYEESDGKSKDYFQIWIYFQDGKEFKMSGSLLPEGFEEFRKEFVDEIYFFYSEYKS